MWFRNLRAFRLPERLGLDAEALASRLSRRPFTPCLPAQPQSSGWVGALDDSAEALVHAAGPWWLLRLKREEKLLPPSVIRDEVANRVAQIQAAEARRVHRKERMQLTDEVTQDLMPRAFTRARDIEALLAERDGWLWVNQASAPRAEDLLSVLRDALGSPPKSKKQPTQAAIAARGLATAHRASKPRAEPARSEKPHPARRQTTPA